MQPWERARSGPRKPEPAEKPYVLLPFATEKPERAVPPGHGLLATVEGGRTVAGVLHFTLSTLTPLHVALGVVGPAHCVQREEFASLPAQVRRYSEAKVRPVPILPGSSLKGAVRSVVEAVSPSCLPVMEVQMEKAVSQYPGRCSDPHQLCPACRLFGNTRYAGHVLFRDLFFKPEELMLYNTPHLWQPGRRNGFKRRYIACGRPAGRKVYYHRTPAEPPSNLERRELIRDRAQASGQLVFEGVRPADLGLLLAALGVDPAAPFPIKVGGGKPVGLGSVRIEVTELLLLTGESVRTQLRQAGRLGTSALPRGETHLTGEALTAWLRAQIEESIRTGALMPDAYARLRAAYSVDGLKKQAPSGPY